MFRKILITMLFCALTVRAYAWDVYIVDNGNTYHWTDCTIVEQYVTHSVFDVQGYSVMSCAEMDKTTNAHRVYVPFWEKYNLMVVNDQAYVGCAMIKQSISEQGDVQRWQCN